MKIAFNPSTVAALTSPPNNKDITFDLKGRNIFARGVKFFGTDTNTWRSILINGVSIGTNILNIIGALASAKDGITSITTRDTWRQIKINNISIGTNTLDLRNGTNVTLVNNNGIVTISSTWRPVVDNLTSTSKDLSLSANMGRYLKSLIDNKSNADHNHDGRYMQRLYLAGDTTNKSNITGYRGSYVIGTRNVDNATNYVNYNGKALDNRSVILHFNGMDGSSSNHWSLIYLNSGDVSFRTENALTWRQLMFKDLLPSSIKNPNAIVFRNINGTTVSYDGSAKVDLSAGTYIAKLPYGFSSWASGVTWGNTTGTSFASWNDSTGGSIDFRRDNPSSGKMSIKVDGRVYVNEGYNPVLSSEHNNGFWGMRTPDGGNDWIRTPNNGLIPYVSGGAGNGHSSLGTSGWYFSTAYIDKVYGSLKGNADSATNADKVDGYHAGTSLKPFGTIPVIGNDGVIELGHYIDFHYDNTSNIDYSTRLQTQGNRSNVVNLPTASGTLALLTDTVSYASKLNPGRKLWGNFFDGSKDISGLITLPSGNHAGIKLANTYLDAIDQALIIHNNSGGIRFGNDAWDWNQWAGLKYNHSSKTIYLGIADGSIFSANSAQTNGTLNLKAGISTIEAPNIKFGNVTSGLCQGLEWTCGDNDFARIKAGATSSNAGYLEIATADDGNEPIYVRQYTGVFSSVKRTLTLLDGNGYSYFPSYINIGGNEGNNSSPNRVWGSNGSDTFLRSYLTSALSVNYANSAGNSDKLDGKHASDFALASHTHGLLHYDLVKTIDNTTTDSGWSMINSTYNGAILKSLRTQGNAPSWIRGNYAAGIAFGSADTKGVLSVAYNSAGSGFRIAGGNGSKPVWWMNIHGTSGKDYNLDAFNPTDYYWANVKVSATSSTTTSPTVSTITATNYLKGGGILIGATNEIWSSNYDIHLQHNGRGNHNVLMCCGGATGRVGIGTDSPGYKFHVNGTSGFNDTIYMSLNKTIRMINNSKDYNLLLAGENLSLGYGLLLYGNNTNIQGNVVNVITGSISSSYTHYFNSNGLYSKFHHKDHNNDDAVLLAGGGYKTLSSIYGGSSLRNVFLGYLTLNHGKDGTISGTFYCCALSVPFTYTRGGNYCTIKIPNTTTLTFFIKAAIASVHYSGGGMNTLVGNQRNEGAWWLHCYASGYNEVRVKGFHLADKNNDSWWGGNPLYEGNASANIITVCLFGCVTVK